MLNGVAAGRTAFPWKRPSSALREVHTVQRFTAVARKTGPGGKGLKNMMRIPQQRRGEKEKFKGLGKVASFSQPFHGHLGESRGKSAAPELHLPFTAASGVCNLRSVR
jgi:hypothetical protein